MASISSGRVNIKVLYPDILLYIQEFVNINPLFFTCKYMYKLLKDAVQRCKTNIILKNIMKMHSFYKKIENLNH